MKMTEVTIETKTDKIEGTLLGQRVSAPGRYAPDILVAVPRIENRTAYNISDAIMLGQDDWYAYECSTLSENGVPEYFALMISYPSNSEFIVESKSLKLYLNSFNMEKFGREAMMKLIKTDLSAKLGTDVIIGLLNDWESDNLESLTGVFKDLRSVVNYNQIIINDYNENPKLLKMTHRYDDRSFRWSFNGFRSRCKVTSQPDYATVFIRYKGQFGVDPESLVKYLSSFRNEDHFHEECCEVIYKRILDAFNPEYLWVRCNYTRRGGIDINPTRFNDINAGDHQQSRTFYQ